MEYARWEKEEGGRIMHKPILVIRWIGGVRAMGGVRLLHAMCGMLCVLCCMMYTVCCMVYGVYGVCCVMCAECCT